MILENYIILIRVWWYRKKSPVAKQNLLACSKVTNYTGSIQDKKISRDRTLFSIFLLKRLQRNHPGFKSFSQWNT